MNIAKGIVVNIGTFRGVIKDTVVSMGGKYITTKKYKFHRDTLREVDPRGCAAYIIEDMEEYYTERERSIMLGEIYSFDWHRLSFEDACNIVNVLDKYKYKDLESNSSKDQDEEEFGQLLLEVQ